MKTIEMFSDAGLCNRLRVLDSCLMLAKELDRKLVVNWPLSNSFKGRFCDLFEGIGNTSFGYSDAMQRPSNSITAMLGKVFPTAVNLEGQLYKDFHTSKPLERNQEFIKSLNRFRQIRINTVHRFLYPEDFSYLQPRSHLRKAISTVTDKFNDHTIGLHIRRGDHRAAIKSSPVEGFVRQMESQLIKNKETLFFLATDDAEIRDSIKKQFGELVIVSGHDLSRNTMAGTESAVVDLWCLSKTNEIWGSKGSSFSETAYHLGDGELKFIEGMRLLGQ